MLTLFFPFPAPTGVQYIDNGRIRLGVDLDKGGAIVWLSKATKPNTQHLRPNTHFVPNSQNLAPNMVNDDDLGRQIQMSYYSGPVPFAPNGKQPAPAWAGLGWNPIQTGDYFGHPSKTLSFHKDGNHIRLTCIPMQWPLNNEPGECTFTSDIRLEGDTVQVENEIDNDRTDHTQFPARTQELPAVYTNGPWYRIFTYEGDRPFTNQPLDPVPTAFPWHSYQATECWTALVGKDDDGLGVWAPGTQSFSAGFFGQPGAGGSSDSPTGYIAPNKDEILDWNIRYRTRYTLILGDLKQIRAYVYSHTKSQPPEWRFSNDRLHWHYANAVDTGWPINGELNVTLDQNDPQIISPTGCWPANKASVLTIEAACRLRDPNAQVFWGRLDAPGFAELRSLRFLLKPDGLFHTYRVRLANSPEYRGTITQLRFDPEPAGTQGDFIRVRSVRLARG